MNKKDPSKTIPWLVMLFSLYVTLLISHDFIKKKHETVTLGGSKTAHAQEILYSSSVYKLSYFFKE